MISIEQIILQIADGTGAPPDYSEEQTVKIYNRDHLAHARKTIPTPETIAARKTIPIGGKK